eukprot:1160656-Pelagomonas_calceolata.AAC.16
MLKANQSLLGSKITTKHGLHSGTAARSQKASMLEAEAAAAAAAVYGECIAAAACGECLYGASSPLLPVVSASMVLPPLCCL